MKTAAEKIRKISQTLNRLAKVPSKVEKLGGLQIRRAEETVVTTLSALANALRAATNAKGQVIISRVKNVKKAIDPLSEAVDRLNSKIENMLNNRYVGEIDLDDVKDISYRLVAAAKRFARSLNNVKGLGATALGVATTFSSIDKAIEDLALAFKTVSEQKIREDFSLCLADLSSACYEVHVGMSGLTSLAKLLE